MGHLDQVLSDKNYQSKNPSFSDLQASVADSIRAELVHRGYDRTVRNVVVNLEEAGGGWGYTLELKYPNPVRDDRSNNYSAFSDFISAYNQALVRRSSYSISDIVGAVNRAITNQNFRIDASRFESLGR